MNGDERKPQSFSWLRRWSAGLNLIITVAAVLALVAMCNYLVIRHYTRLHWSRDTEGALSQRTLQVLASLTNTVKIITYYDSDDPLFPRVKALIKEYQFASPHIQVQFVDYVRDAVTARTIKERYQLNAVNDKNLVIFDSNGTKGVVNAAELSDYDYSKMISGETNEAYRTHFKGELYFTSKIFAVANNRKPVAYFLGGHNEHPPEGADNESYGKFSSMLINYNNFDLRAKWLSGTNEIPSDCNLLIIAGPTDPLEPATLEKIQRYLESGGRMLVAFSGGTERRRPTGLEQLLRNWGVEVGENPVIDIPHSTGKVDVVPVELGKHPIVGALQNSQVQLYMPRPVRAVRSAGRSEELKVDELLLTGPETLVVSGRTADLTQRGPKSLMAVVEKGVPGLQRGSTRIVVVGDSTLWSNQLFDSVANGYLAAFSANWLVSQNVLLSDIERSAIRNYKLTMTRTQLRSVQWILLAGMPGLALLAGIVVWMRRRH